MHIWILHILPFLNLRISYIFEILEINMVSLIPVFWIKGMPVLGVLGVVGPLVMQAVGQKQPLEQGDEE